MSRYILRRVLQVVPVVFGLSVAVFLMLRLIPGDVVDVILGTEGVASQERLAQLRKLFGLDRPFHEQYFEWAGSLLRGDFGRSIRTSRPILPDILARFPVTIQLTAMAMVMSLALAIPLGVVSAVRRYTRSDAAVRVFGLLGLSIPNFWLATMLILLASRYWRGVLPTSGYVYPSQDLVGSFRSVLLPALALGAANMAILMRMTRSSMLEVLRQEYVVTARAKGLVERLVVYRHALRNALIPVVTVAGIQVGYLLGGAIIVEQIFALPGVGTLVLNGISQRDYPVVQGGVLFIATSFVLVNLAVDIVYAYVDPKIHYQ
ncbi:MAG TPA: ABC transporter permease [Chloroflexota bacterium]|nr:ABC transporter permease [Chloroflexota bacterium]